MYFEENKLTSPTNENIKNAKINGIGLAWKEAWPTYFAVSAQSTFSSDLKKVPTVGDARYDAFNGVTYSLKDNHIFNGEACERTIMYFLYRLWDTDNSIACDKISISDSDLWTFMVVNNPENFSDFISKLYSSDLNFSRSDLGLLLEGHKISASNLSVSVTTDYTTSPSFSWTKNGSDIYYNGNTYNYGNNKFSLYFYDSNKKLIQKKDNIYTNYYTLTKNEWDSILIASGSKYYVVIQSYATLGSESGPYYSQYYEFTKPVNATVNATIKLSNDRYYEKTLAISQGTSWIFDLSFDHSGDKMIQTFGSADTKMWLYEPDGTTLIDTDDDGYERNAFINCYLQSGKKYILKVNLYSSSYSAKTRLSITPNCGFKNDNDPSLISYENIYHIHSWHNFTLGSYMKQYNSMVITWTPPESGNYSITLTSEFDNYLYVIDPRSAELNVRNVHENDDSGSTNAKLEGYYEKDMTYFVVYSQYNPSRDFANLDSGDDITVKFNKL